MDRNDLCVEDDQKVKVSSESSSPFPHDVTAVLDFSELRPSQFGISVKSFIPAATPKGERSAASVTYKCCLSVSDGSETRLARIGVMPVWSHSGASSKIGRNEGFPKRLRILDLWPFNDQRSKKLWFKFIFVKLVKGFSCYHRREIPCSTTEGQAEVQRWRPRLPGDELPHSLHCTTEVEICFILSNSGGEELLNDTWNQSRCCLAVVEIPW